MIKVITYGTYDLLHDGHIRLLERAKALGDHLTVGITSDDYDRARGKINNQQPLMERIEAVRNTGLADEIIVEEYDGQKIDDIKRLGIDIFTVGSDWEGKFDYLNAYCKVVYLPRTEGISSTDIRAHNNSLRIGFIGDYESRILMKYHAECAYVDGLEFVGICSDSDNLRHLFGEQSVYITDDYDELLDRCDAVYVLSHPSLHYEHTKFALLKGKHVLCESPIGLSGAEYRELENIARGNNLVLMNSTKTAYCTAYNRLLLLVNSGIIGDIVSIDATCTSIQPVTDIEHAWNSICSWGPTAFLPVFQILGTDYKDVRFATRYLDEQKNFDIFSKISFIYPHSVAEVKVGRGIKSEGELIISGTKGYVYVPAPWWKTDYFEVRYEDANNNKRYFYQLEGEGIRYEFVVFLKNIFSLHAAVYIGSDINEKISDIMQMYYNRENLVSI